MNAIEIVKTMAARVQFAKADLTAEEEIELLAVLMADASRLSNRMSVLQNDPEYRRRAVQAAAEKGFKG